MRIEVQDSDIWNEHVVFEKELLVDRLDDLDCLNFGLFGLGKIQQSTAGNSVA